MCLCMSSFTGEISILIIKHSEKRLRAGLRPDGAFEAVSGFKMPSQFFCFWQSAYYQTSAKRTSAGLCLSCHLPAESRPNVCYIMSETASASHSGVD